MNIVNDILVNTLFPDTDFVQTLEMNSVVPKYVENQEKGNPSVCKNCAEAPFKDLQIYGRSEQMTTTGAQLIDINSFQKNNDISVKIVNNYSIELTSTIKKDASDSSRLYLNVVIDADVLVGKTITMSYDGWNSNVPNEVAACGIMYNINGKNNYESIFSDSRIKTVTIPLGAKDCKVRLFLVENASATVKAGTYTAIIKGLMICEGTVAKSWEPYTGGKPSPSPDYPQEIQSAGDDGNLSVIVKKPDNEQTQSVSFSTSNGLPGIPVTSGGNYTDENGQQWICDEVDLGRGVYVQRVDKGAFDATKALTEQSVILATPIETPLTATEIAAYKSLRTYRGTTIVEAEDKAGISVKYNMPMPKLSKNGALRRWFKRHPII